MDKERRIEVLERNLRWDERFGKKSETTLCPKCRHFVRIIPASTNCPNCFSLIKFPKVK